VAIVMAAALIRDLHGPDALILVMPSDHRIENPEAFHEAVALAVAAATAGLLVTFAIQPTGPETGYGYLEAGEPLKAGSRTFRVARFTEKPVREVAEAMVAGGQHYWNGGIFLYSARALLAEAARLAPEILKPGEQAIAAAQRDGACVLPDRTALEPCPNLSIDYAVMERSDKVAMVPLSAGWSDVGGWDALAKLPAPVANKQLITLMNSANCYVRSDGLKLSLLGVDDLIVVAKGDRVLIMRKGESGHIRELAAQANAS
jgi:mannose-1-phosphate guanylyltransferase/mannose-1-phosphate guanylyltransferase/mannose-6-phosphate isomerase